MDNRRAVQLIAEPGSRQSISWKKSIAHRGFSLARAEQKVF